MSPVITIKLIILCQTLAAAKRPFYNLAHMSNSKEDVLLALQSGANGIEFDVRFTADGTPSYVYHGYICDCLRNCNDRTEFDEFLDVIRELTTPDSKEYNQNFTFAFVDLKTDVMVTEEARKEAGRKLYLSLMEHLYNDGKPKTKLRLLLSMLTMNDDQIVDGFMAAMASDGHRIINKYIAWDISDGYFFRKLIKKYKKINVWMTDGITNCLSMITPHDRLRDAVALRDAESYVSKVCHWTVDLRTHIRQTLRLGVDSVLTNYPANVLRVLNEPEFVDKYRLADHNDNPWIRYREPKEFEGFSMAE